MCYGAYAIRPARICDSCFVWWCVGPCTWDCYLYRNQLACCSLILQGELNYSFLAQLQLFIAFMLPAFCFVALLADAEHLLSSPPAKAASMLLRAGFELAMHVETGCWIRVFVSFLCRAPRGNARQVPITRVGGGKTTAGSTGRLVRRCSATAILSKPAQRSQRHNRARWWVCQRTFWAGRAGPIQYRFAQERIPGSSGSKCEK